MARGLSASVTIEGDVREILRDEVRAGEFAVTAAISAAGTRVKEGWRGQVRASGLGNRLAGSIRSEVYPRGGVSARAAALVWSKAPQIVDAFERGVTIRSKDGFWLAIPTAAAGRSSRGGRISPGEWERRTGHRLRFVFRRGKTALLVADEARVNKGGHARPKRGKRRRDGIMTGEQTVPIFVLVPQARMPKKLDFTRDAVAAQSALPGAIVANWREVK
ncbi:DUF6441 family protein [Frigidibacter sp. MR17.14]|uniref:DUF6441 family protein n=1 Tax=Frigidibacter sp. MR17.14 TaxID=3126509 RepID=UPI003012A7AD